MGPGNSYLLTAILLSSKEPTADSPSGVTE